MNFKPGMNTFYYTRCRSRAPPISGVGGASTHVDRVRKSPFYAPLWLLTARDRRLARGSNVGSVRLKIQTANKPSLKPKALTALKWW